MITIKQGKYTPGSEKKPVKTRYQVRVISSECIGASCCLTVADMTFKLNYQTGRADIIDQDGNVDEEKMLAAKGCPAAAIEVIDTVTGKKIWPK